MNIFDPHISGSLSVSGSGEISGDLRVLGTINATISGTTSNAISASHAAEYTLTSSFHQFTSSYTTGAFTGSFIGDGSGLHSIPASGVVGLNLNKIISGSVSASISPNNGFEVNTNTTVSGHITPSVDNEYDLGSPTHQWRDVYISSGSLYIDGSKVLSSTTQELTITTDNGQSLKILEGTTDSIVLQTADGNIELKSSADGDILIDPTNGKILLKGPVEVLSGQKIQSSVGGTPVVFANDIVVSGSIDLTGTIDGIDLSSFSSSINNLILDIDGDISSLNSFTSSINTTIKSKLDSDGVVSGSSQIILSGTTGFSTVSASLSSLSSSISITNLNQDGRLNSIEGKTGSFATTGSNTFVGSQVISGSVTIRENLIVLGSSSITYTTSSQLRVDDNVIVVNTSSPAERFGGLQVYDSGSVGEATGSLFWDSEKNRWVYQQSSEASYGGGVLMSGPRSSGSLGDELTLTSGKIARSAGGDHLNDSIITEYNATTIGINGNLEITGSIISSVTPLVSGSSQISYTGLVNVPSGIVSGSSQIIYSSISSIPSGIVSGSSQITYSSISSIPSGIVSGSSQISYPSLSNIPGGIVSGSSQIDLTATTNYSSGIKTRLNAEGVISGSSQVLSGTGIVSGSSQITLSSTTGYGSVLNQAVLTTSSPTFAGLTSNGVGVFNSTNDTQISLRSTDAWSGIEFDDSGTPDYIWYNGGNQTFSIGGGGGNVSGKKLHVHGGVTIGSSYTATSVATNGLAVEGAISASNFSGSHTGTSSGTNTGDQTNISGNAATATNSTNLSGLGIIQSTSTGTSYTTNYQVRENSGGGGNTNEIYAPQLAFHWSGVVASSIMMESSGRIAIRNNPGGAYENFIAGTIYASSSFQGNLTGNVTGNVSGTANNITAYTINQSVGTSNSPTFSNIYANDWYRNNAVNEGLYNEATNNHWYSENNGRWTAAGTNATYGEISLRYGHQGTYKGSYYWDNSGIGLLNEQGGWSVRCNYGSGYGGTLYGSWTVTGTLTETSSLRYKTNIQTIESGLDKVLQMRGVVYKRKDNGKEEIGVIAEEMNEILPQVIQYNTESEIDSVSYSRIVGVLIEAIKELKQEINDLKNNG